MKSGHTINGGFLRRNNDHAGVQGFVLVIDIHELLIPRGNRRRKSSCRCCRSIKCGPFDPKTIRTPADLHNQIVFWSLGD